MENIKLLGRYNLRPTTIDKIIRIGSYKNNHYKNKLPIFCRIKYKDRRLSITGVVAPVRSGNCKGSCGQIDGEIIENLDKLTFADGWDKAKAFQFVEYWKEWHLNDMQAGCKHQRAEKDETIGKSCSVCSYKYGSKWFHKEIPTKVLKWLESLPERDKIPA